MEPIFFHKAGAEITGYQMDDLTVHRQPGESLPELQARAVAEAKKIIAPGVVPTFFSIER